MTITVEQLATALPPKLKSSATQALADRINNAVSDPILAEQMRNNFISYVGIMKDGSYKMDDYLNAVMYVSYKLMGMSNQDAYFRTFPARHQALLAKGTSSKDIGAYVYAYNKGKLVNSIMEQTLVPSWVLNQHLYQEALNVQADLMHNAMSEMVRTTAANSILTQLQKPKEAGPLINIDLNESSGMNELKDLLGKMAKQQVSLIESGVSVESIASQKIIDVDSKEV